MFKISASFRILILFTGLFFLSINLFGQSPYSIDWKKEPFFLAIGGGAMASGVYLSSQLSNLTAEEVSVVNRSNVNSFDRPATFNNSSHAGHLSDYLWLSSQVIPGLLMLDKRVRGDFSKILLIYAETALINGSLTNVAKAGFRRNRPYVYNPDIDLEKKLSRSARYSFFSGHTSITATNTFFAAKVFNDYFPDSPWRKVVWSAAAVIPALTGYARVKAGKHYATDVIFGYAVGASIGFLVPHLHLKKYSEKSITLTPSGNGAVLVYSF